MKIGIFNGMSTDNKIENIIVNNLNGYELENLKLRDMKIGYCRCCGGCAKSKKCVQNDDGIEVVESYKYNDVIIYLTPIKYGAYSKEIKKFIDRLLPIGDDKLLVKEGYMIHKIIYNGKKAIIIGVIDKESKEEELAFNSLVKANYINMDWKSYSQLIINKNLKEMDMESKIKDFLKGAIGDV